MINAFVEGVTEAERAEFEEWFGVENVHPAHRGTGEETAPRVAKEAAGRHIVSATLFWKHVNGEDPELPRPTRELLVDAKRLGLVKRFSPWDSYINPLFLHSTETMKGYPEMGFRLYLAGDLGSPRKSATGRSWACISAAGAG